MLSSSLHRTGQPGAAQAGSLTPGANSASRLQAQSLAALAKLKQKQADQARQRAEVIRALRTTSAQAAKAAARERIEMIKKRIEEMQRLLAMLGGIGAKGALQELKQLSSQLKGAAAILRSGSETPAPEDGGADAGADADHAEGRAAYADQQRAADAESHAPLIPPVDRSSQHSERDDDESLIEQVRKALRFARSMAESYTLKSQ